MSAAALPESEKKILIVEADPILQEEWSNALRDYGFKVAVTADAEDGMVKAEKARPDVILLRVELPNANGYKLVKRLKEHDNLKDVPLILLSSEASEKDFDTHKKTKSRAQAYRKLPVSFDDILEDVENLVGLPGPMMAAFQAEAVPAEKYNELEGQRSELLVEVDRLKEQLDSHTQQNGRLEGRVQELEQLLTAKAGAAAEGLASELASLRAELDAIRVERDDARAEVDSKKRIVNKLKENLTKLEGRPAEDLTGRVAQLEEELVDARAEVDSKKKVVAKLKENIGKLEASTVENKDEVLTELENLRGEVEGKKKVIATLKARIETTDKEMETLVPMRGRVGVAEADLAGAKEQIVRMKETIADLTITADEAKRNVVKAMRDKEEAIDARGTLEKGHQKELDALKQLYEPRVTQLKKTEQELDQAKEKIRQLDRSLDEEARKNRERDDEYADKVAQIKRDHAKNLVDQDRAIDDMKKTIERLEEEKSKMEQRVVKAYRKLRADESQLEKVRKALEIAMNFTKAEDKDKDKPK